MLSYLTPSGWGMDPSGKRMREHILEKYTLNFFYQFENRAKFFKDVVSQYKVAVWQIQPTPMESGLPD